MLYAKSMYLLGDIVSAEECNYESSRDLGLRCPCCSNAVYLRRGYWRSSKKEKWKYIKPFFSHYKAGTIRDYECKNRFPPAKRQEKLEKIQFESHNQRLKLYNEHLWNMIREDRNISKKFTKQSRKIFGDRYIDNATNNLRNYLVKHLDLAYDWIAEYVDVLSDPREFQKEIEKIPVESIGIHQYKDQMVYFGEKCNLRMHKTICCEIIDFLSTRTGGYALGKVVACLLLRTFQAETHRLASFVPLKEKAMKESKREVRRFFLDPQMLANGMTPMIASTHWIDIIRKYLDEDAI